MSVRKQVVAAVVVALAALSGANVALAQGSKTLVTAPSALPAAASPPPGPSTAARPVVGAPAAGTVEPVFVPPAVLDRAWARVVRAVLDGVKSVVDAERIEASEFVGRSATGPDASARPPTSPVHTTLAMASVPAHAVREALETSQVQPAPVPIDPPSETGTDTRGEHAVLLGVRMELPWRVP